MDCNMCVMNGQDCEEAKAILQELLRPAVADICPMMLASVIKRPEGAYGKEADIPKARNS